jgi:cytochrome bd-type quinol oxidase subunit 1
MSALARLGSRGAIALGCWLLVLAVLGMILFDRSLLESDAFLILATAIVITGWVQGPVGWAYQATKQGGELADRAAGAALRDAPGATREDP